MTVGDCSECVCVCFAVCVCAAYKCLESAALALVDHASKDISKLNCYRDFLVVLQITYTSPTTEHI